MNERIRIELLLAAVLAVYANSLLNGFTYDDEAYVLHNPAVKSFSLSGLLQPTSFNNVFRPMTFGSFALNWAAGGGWALGFHLVNVLLHAAVVVLLYVLLKELLEPLPQGSIVAFAAALLFAVHPIHTEAVASIVGRSELLAAGFLLAAWLLHLDDRPVLSLVCLLLALLSKESAVVFLPLVMAGDYVRGKRKPLTRYGWMAGVIGLYLLLFWRVEGGRFGEKSVSFLDNPLASLPAHWRVLNALGIGWKYVGLHFYPARLSSDYSYNAIRLYASWWHLAPALVATVLVLGAWLWAVWKRQSAWTLAGVIYLFGFAVTANLFIPTGTIMGERLAYLPSAGFCLLVALLWAGLERRESRLAWTVLGVLLTVLGARAALRNRDWRDNFTLFAADARSVPGSARAHGNLGREYMKRGQLEAARSEFQTALAIWDDYPITLENYGLVESWLGHYDNARRLLESALSKTQKGTLDYDQTEVSLAVQLIKLARTEEALELLNRVIKERSECASAWSSRAVIHQQRGEVAAAKADAEMALTLNPVDGQAKNVLTALNGMAGRSSPR